MRQRCATVRRLARFLTYKELHVLPRHSRSEQQSAVVSHGPLIETQQTIFEEPLDGCEQTTPPLTPVPPQQSKLSKHGLRSLLQRQRPVRLLFLRRQRLEQHSLSRSHRSPICLPYATSFAAASGVDASARPESATAARSNPRRPMILVMASKRSVSMGRHLESDERRLAQRVTLTAAYHGVEIIRPGACGHQRGMAVLDVGSPPATQHGSAATVSAMIRQTRRNPCPRRPT
jgi:hypothetical protein